MFLFCVAISLPIGYFVFRTYQSLNQEETAELRFFAETIFQEMEKDLADLVIREEGRAIDEYNLFYTPRDSQQRIRSPLSTLSDKPFILGYLQNNPDGSFQTPMEETLGKSTDDLSYIVGKLKDVNQAFNLKQSTLQLKEGMPKTEAPMLSETNQRQQAPVFADKYIDTQKSRKKKSSLGQEEKWREQVTAEQALSLAQSDKKNDALGDDKDTGIKKENASFFDSLRSGRLNAPKGNERAVVVSESEAHTDAAIHLSKKIFEAEVAPLQSMFISKNEIFVFRRVMINNSIFRQGFVLLVPQFLKYISETHFDHQPMAKFSNLHLSAMEKGKEICGHTSGSSSGSSKNFLIRQFPRPFSFLTASLRFENIPPSAGRKTLGIMLTLTALVILAGLFAIHQSARTINDMSERRQAFASSVTHELKTPLTNIRLYIEMLENGIARDLEREQEYYRILGSESSRLSRLINNVLEFSKLDRKTRLFNLEKGTFDNVIKDVQDAMQEKLNQEGFTLNIEKEPSLEFQYDREVMVQILINLIENSLKFSKHAASREILILADRHHHGRVTISVSDKGPGIPEKALKKIFDDFYRVDNTLTRTTGGTGIGLSLVKKFVTALGGKVHAENNNDAGCRIVIELPPESPRS